ncbi:hypothetical protein [Virgibacillus sediminis]|uniref:Uncharacterized protein n=1 Tax=Virgibacillus sediminis TaxID=202260 RepID=A0ABV7A3U1_9BACI
MEELMKMKGTVAAEDFEADSTPVDVHVSATPYISTEQRYSNIINECNNMQKASSISKEDIGEIERQLHFLPKGSEMYEVCLFHLRTLKKKFPKTPAQMEEQLQPETKLVQLKHNRFIDAGRCGRKWVAEQLPGDTDDSNLVRLAEVKLDLLDELLNDLKKAEKTEEIIELYNQLDIHVPHNLKEMTADRWREDDTSSIRTLTHAVSRVERYIEEMKEKGITEETMDKELLDMIRVSKG